MTVEQLYDNRDTNRRELWIDGQHFAEAPWQWIVDKVSQRDKFDWLYRRWRPNHRFGHYEQPGNAAHLTADNSQDQR